MFGGGGGERVSGGGPRSCALQDEEQTGDGAFRRKAQETEEPKRPIGGLRAEDEEGRHGGGVCLVVCGPGRTMCPTSPDHTRHAHSIFDTLLAICDPPYPHTPSPSTPLTCPSDGVGGFSMGGGGVNRVPPNWRGGVSGIGLN